VDWVCDKGYGNVIIEIANEVMEGHYHHAILKPGRVSELIRRARERARNQHGRAMLVSTSEAALLSDRQWAEAQIDEVFSATDLGSSKESWSQQPVDKANREEVRHGVRSAIGTLCIAGSDMPSESVMLQ
jgi:hypothetical protein